MGISLHIFQAYGYVIPYAELNKIVKASNKDSHKPISCFKEDLYGVGLKFEHQSYYSHDFNGDAIIYLDEDTIFWEKVGGYGNNNSTTELSADNEKLSVEKSRIDKLLQLIMEKHKIKLNMKFGFYKFTLSC
jgi:hypothetical protein